MPERHPNWEEILDHVEAGEPDGSPVSRHLPGCASCTRLAGEIRHVFEIIRHSRLAEPPREAVERAIAAVLNELAAEPAAGERLLSGSLAALREIWAALVGDSLALGAVVRAGGTARERTLLFETDDYAITLSLTPAQPAGFEVIGQVSPRASNELPSGGRAVLTAAGATDERTLSPFGEFVFENASGAMTDLSIVLAGDRIRLDLPTITA